MISDPAVVARLMNDDGVRMRADADVTRTLAEEPMCFSLSCQVGRLLGDLGEDLRVTDEQVLVLADLDRVAAPAGKEHLVTGLDRSGDHLAVLVGSTGASSNDAGFGKGRRGSRRGNEETGRGLGLGLEALDEDSVEERDDRLDRADGGLSGLLRRQVVGTSREGRGVRACRVMR